MRRTVAPTLATLCAVGGVIAVTVWSLHPGLLLSTTTTTGGDTGAHFGLAAFLKSNLVPHGHVTGWDPGAYDGFPLNTFYFPLPDLIAALLGYVIPFTVAFKLVTILGSVTLPVAAWAFGRLAGLERPIPAVLAVATLPFLFDQTFTIYGGNLYSTMAGEYAYSLGLSFALVFLGVAIRGMRTGRLRASAAVLLAATMLCHLVTGGLAFVGAVAVFVAAGPSWRRLWWMVSAGGTGFLLVAWWAVPFVLEQAYTTNMGWTNVTTWAALIAPGADRWALALALVGLVFAVVRRQRTVMMLAALGVLSAVGMVIDPQGKLYNVRLLPLWLLFAYLVAGYGFAVLGILVAQAKRRFSDRLWAESLDTSALPHHDPWAPAPLARTSMAPTLAAAGVGAEAAAGVGAEAAAGAYTPVPVLAGAPGPGIAVDPPPAPGAGSGWHAAPPPPGQPGQGPSESADGSYPGARGPGHPEWGRPARWPSPDPGQRPWWQPRFAPGALTVPFVALMAAAAVVMPPLLVTPGSNFSIGPVHVQASNVPSWAQWNYSGYEGKPGWPELHNGIIDTLDRVTKQDGCGRAMWEYNSDLNRFGTPMALMLLPYWTNNCVDSIEGVLFESSATTPYHFLNQAELSAGPSEAVVGLNYGPVDVALGVEHLQLLGIKYFMASSPNVQAQADADPELSLVATTGPWHTPYNGQDLITTWKIYEVHNAPVVSALTQRPDVLVGTAPGQTTWLPVAQKWYADPADFTQQLVSGGPSSWPRTTAGDPSPKEALPAVRVTDVRVGTDSVSFHVSRAGVPVLVAESYFPAWHATGATGPWRAEPNLMVVDPTSHDVTLSYGSSPDGQLGLALSAVGLVCLAVLIRRRHALTVP